MRKKRRTQGRSRHGYGVGAIFGVPLMVTVLFFSPSVPAASAAGTHVFLDRFGSAALPTFTFSYQGFVNGDTASVLDTAPTIGAGLSTAQPGSYAITGTGGADNDYTFNFTDGTLTVRWAGYLPLLMR